MAWIRVVPSKSRSPAGVPSRVGMPGTASLQLMNSAIAQTTMDASGPEEGPSIGDDSRCSSERLTIHRLAESFLASAVR